MHWDWTGLRDGFPETAGSGLRSPGPGIMDSARSYARIPTPCWYINRARLFAESRKSSELKPLSFVYSGPGFRSGTFTPSAKKMSDGLVCEFSITPIFGHPEVCDINMREGTEREMVFFPEIFNLFLTLRRKLDHVRRRP